MTRLENPVKPTPDNETQPVRLRILSDLHLGRTRLELPHVPCDIVILAGDISRPQPAIEWAREMFDQPVLYVPGNHEFYGNSLQRTLDELQRHTKNTNIHVLNNREIVLQGIRFLGSTLWSDFNLDGPDVRNVAIDQARTLIRDFSRIESDSIPGTPFSPDEMEHLFERNRTWLTRHLQQPSASTSMPTVVITHHAPSPHSIHPRFAGSPLNACFVSDCEALMGHEKVQLWIHGHTHNSFDYLVNGTRVICNPRGYMVDGKLENPDFDPLLTITVGKTAPDTKPGAAHEV